MIGSNDTLLTLASILLTSLQTKPVKMTQHYYGGHNGTDPVKFIKDALVLWSETMTSKMGHCALEDELKLKCQVLA